MLPGYAQMKLHRPNAAALFGVAEVFTIGMSRKAALDLRQARRGARDSVPLTYETDAVTGLPVIDTLTGRPKVKAYAPNRFTPERVRARKTHYEDWIAAIVFNHLISGADAYVAANLWDLPVNIGAGLGARRASVIATVAW